MKSIYFKPIRIALFSLIIFLFSKTNLNAQDLNAYYSGTENLSGWQLKTALNHILSNHPYSWHYGDLPTIFELTDRDLYYENDSSMLDIYSENVLGADPYNYSYDSFQMIAGATAEGQGWNREHCFSQSFFYSNYPMYSDMHFIVPTDARVNQRRSNYPPGNVANPTFTSMNGSKVGQNSTAGYSLSAFEPIDEFKGDFARMLLYAAVRYENLLPLFQVANQRNPFYEKREIAVRDWLIPVFIAWHQLDPVSQREIDRNNKVFAIQHNRNPFVDHPEWVAAIWTSDTSGATTPEAPIYLDAITKGKHFVTLTWETAPNNNAIGFEVYKNDSLIETVKEKFYTFTALDSNTAYQFSVRAYNKAYAFSPMSAALTATTLTEDTFATNLFFSKYIEGTGNNNALEISNLTGHSVDLRHYYIRMRQYNFEDSVLYWGANEYQMEGYLQHGKKIVLLHPEWNLECFSIDSADFITAGMPLTFNGIYALDLRNDSTTIDRIGNPYTYDTFAAQMSLYRKSEIKNPNKIFIAEEWNAMPLDYCDSLGIDYTPQDTTTYISQPEQKFLKLYPNPVVDGKLFISGNGLEAIAAVEIFNSNGKLMKQVAHPFRKQNFIDVADLKAGSYVLKTKLGNYKFTIIR